MYYIVEAFLIFFSFFLPGYLLPPIQNPNDFLNSPIHMSIYIFLSFLQLVFMLFILYRDKNIPLTYFGIVKPGIKDFIHAIFFTIGLYIIYFIMILAILALPGLMQELLSGGFKWQLENTFMIPLLFFFCIVTGYREELIFRSYIFTRCSQINLPIPYTIFLSVISFSILHFYEGISGFLFAFFSGLYLSVIFILKKNLHIVAISHGIFNFLSLLLTLLE